MRYPLSCLLVPALAAASNAYDFGSIQYSDHFGILGQNGTFDYVVVGSGPGGMTIATRLAEANHSVALVEAGGFYEVENGNLTVTPGYYTDNLGHIGVDWNFSTTPQPQLYNASVVYNRGKTLGGTSALNAMLYQRGTVGSYKQWADFVNDTSYEWDSFLPFFQRSANYTPPNTAIRAANATVPSPGPNAYIETGGPLHVTHSNWAAPFSSWSQLGLREMGLPDIQDFESGSLIGAQYCPLTVDPQGQTRGSSEATYLRSYLSTGNVGLQIFSHTLAKKILFNESKWATGVQVETYGKDYTLSATKEVIISAGAFQSPQLLMISGLGPKEELSKYNIDSIVDLPGVGQNMQDHILIGVIYLVNVTTTAVLRNATIAKHFTDMYRENATGILASNNADFLGWEKIPSQYRANLSSAAQTALDKYPADWPDLEFVAGSFPAYPKALSPALNYAFMEVALISPQSRGTISLTSDRMVDAPAINVGWLTNPIDIEQGIVALKRGRDFFGAQAIKPVLLGSEALPGSNISTDAQIEEYLRKAATTVYHASCTCAMGLRDDSMAVLDSRARVYGVQNLRVVDASSFPFLPPGHPQSTIYALAEKIAADIIGPGKMASL